jgi:hypothetical protein
MLCRGIAKGASSMKKVLLGATLAFLFGSLPAMADSLSQISPTPTGYIQGVDFFSFVNGLPGNATASVFDVASGGDGCNSSQFGGFIAGDIALVERGNCSFSVLHILQTQLQ